MADSGVNNNNDDCDHDSENRTPLWSDFFSSFDVHSHVFDPHLRAVLCVSRKDHSVRYFTRPSNLYFYPDDTYIGIICGVFNEYSIDVPLGFTETDQQAHIPEPANSKLYKEKRAWLYDHKITPPW